MKKIILYNQADVDFWFKKAKDDILWAKSSSKDEFYSPACFVAQQAAEKALKALYFGSKKNFNQQEIKRSRTHDLTKISKLIENQNFIITKKIKKACQSLNDFYLPTRYPDIPDSIDIYNKEIAEKAIKKAEEIVVFVEKHFPSKNS